MNRTGVAWLVLWLAVWAATAGAGENQVAAHRLDPALRAKMLMALLGVALAGVGLLAFVIVAARYVRRLARQDAGPNRAIDDRWYAKPLVPPETNERHDEHEE